MKITTKERNRRYYLKNRKELIKKAIERGKNPEVRERKNKRNRERYAVDEEIRKKWKLAREKYLSNPENRRRLNLTISIWGMTKRSKEENALKWRKYYSKNKEKYCKKRKADRLKWAVIRRALVCKDSSIPELKNDIAVLLSLNSLKKDL